MQVETCIVTEEGFKSKEMGSSDGRSLQYLPVFLLQYRCYTNVTKYQKSE